MLYKAKVAVYSHIRTKQLNAKRAPCNVKPLWYVKKPLGFEMLSAMDAQRPKPTLQIRRHIINRPLFPRPYELLIKFLT
jgi:hypothetical protein